MLAFLDRDGVMKSRFPIQIYPERCWGVSSCKVKQRQCHSEEEGLQACSGSDKSTLGNRLENIQELIHS